MFAYERRNEIVERIKRNSSVATAELMDTYQVSLETIRKDLEFLQKQGTLKRVHGGAVIIKKLQDYASLSTRTEKYREEKRKLALAACNYISEGDCIALDAGSTSFELAAMLCERFNNLTVVTNSFEVFRILSEKEGIRKILTGGFYLAGEKAFYGHLTMDMMHQLHVSKCFITPSAISLDFGISDHIQELIAIQRVMIEISDQVFVQVDSSKFESCAPLKICDINPKHIYLTDAGLSDETLEVYRKASFNIIRYM